MNFRIFVVFGHVPASLTNFLIVVMSTSSIMAAIVDRYTFTVSGISIRVLKTRITADLGFITTGNCVVITVLAVLNSFAKIISTIEIIVLMHTLAVSVLHIVIAPFTVCLITNWTPVVVLIAPFRRKITHSTTRNFRAIMDTVIKPWALFKRIFTGRGIFSGFIAPAAFFIIMARIAWAGIPHIVTSFIMTTIGPFNTFNPFSGCFVIPMPAHTMTFLTSITN